MEPIGLLMGLCSGAVGGNVAGKLMRSKMGIFGRSVVGIVGGVALSHFAPMIPLVSDIFADPSSGAYSREGMIANLISGATGGAFLTFILGMMSRKV